MRRDREISFASDTLGKEIGEGISRLVHSPKSRARDSIAKSIVGMVGDNIDVGEAIIGDSTGILIVDGPIARALGMVSASANLGQISGG
jgi:hypothetical protein